MRRHRFGPDGYAELRDTLMRGEFSGHAYAHDMDKIAAALEGEAEFVICWAEGDSFTGLRISGGKAIEMDVVMTLREKA